MTIALQTGIVYGPLQSRRFGKSLGINLLPRSFKLCSFDCGYCQYDESFSTDAPRFPELGEIQGEVTAHFSELAETGAPDWIMLSGNGEPTLHPRFPQAVDTLIEARNALLPRTRIGILTNGSTCRVNTTRQALVRLDARFLKLDAGNQACFLEINQPLCTTGLEAFLDHLRMLAREAPSVIQSMFVGGVHTNAAVSDVEDWVKAVQYVSPAEVHLYTVDRKPRDPSFLPVGKNSLEGIARLLRRRTGIKASVY